MSNHFEITKIKYCPNCGMEIEETGFENFGCWSCGGTFSNQLKALDCERQVESDFTKALNGIVETNNIDKPYLVTNYLKTAYETGSAQGLSENLILKYCFVVLSNIINNDITEKYFKVSFGVEAERGKTNKG